MSEPQSTEPVLVRKPSILGADSHTSTIRRGTQPEAVTLEQVQNPNHDQFSLSNLLIIGSKLAILIGSQGAIEETNRVLIFGDN